MNEVYLGKIVTTHGIKGELRILSDFPFKEKAFRIGNHLIIDNNSYEIKTYRVHKNYDMVTLDNYTNINEVLFLLKKDVYIEKEELELSEDEILDEELIEYKVVTTDNRDGEIKEIFNAGEDNKILRVEFTKEVLIPYNSPMIKKIDRDKKEIIVELISGME